MFKSAISIMSMLVLVLGIFVFKTSYNHHQLSKKLHLIESQITHSEENIHLLQAEWSLVNSPKNIQMLCEQHLPHLEHTHYQLASLSHLDTIKLNPDSMLAVAQTETLKTASNN